MGNKDKRKEGKTAPKLTKAEKKKRKQEKKKQKIKQAFFANRNKKNALQKRNKR